MIRQDRADEVIVEFMDPTAVLDLVGNPAVGEVAREVRQKLEHVLQAL